MPNSKYKPVPFKRFKPEEYFFERICLLFLDCLPQTWRNIVEYRMGFGLKRALTHKEVGYLLNKRADQIIAEEKKIFSFVLRACREQLKHELYRTYRTPIETLKLSKPLLDRLHGGGILFVEHLCQLSADDVQTLTGLSLFGVNSLRRKMLKAKKDLRARTGSGKEAYRKIKAS